MSENPPASLFRKTARVVEAPEEPAFELTATGESDDALGSLWLSNLEREGIDPSGLDFEFSSADDLDTGAAHRVSGPRFRIDQAPRLPGTPSGPRVDGPYRRIDEGSYVGANQARGGMPIAEIRAAARESGFNRQASSPPRTSAPPVVRQEPARVSNAPTYFERLINGKGPLD